MSISAAPAKRSRPLSPHLSVYKKQLTSATSIIHRMTGVGLCLGLPVLVTWLLALSKGPSYYSSFIVLMKTPLCQVLLAGWTWAFFYHLCNGIRHLIWDTGRLLDIKSAYLAGYIAIAASFLLTALVWLIAHGVI